MVFEMAEAKAETSSPPQKKAQLSLSLKKGRRTATNERFEFVDVAEVYNVINTLKAVNHSRKYTKGHEMGSWSF